MENQAVKVTINATVNAPVAKVWENWTTPADIMQWNNASPDWHTPRAENDLRKGGSFLSRMEAKDGSFGFDFTGIYDEVITNKHIAYTMPDGRKVKIDFTDNGDSTGIQSVFDAETENPVDMQRDGWQAILNNFKQYTENTAG
ncbi:MAG: SRPBCC family protein [Flavipsychrobacter sp.]|nr:SRPBCC family protein [Flavipsychrobacter sp.]